MIQLSEMVVVSDPCYEGSSQGPIYIRVKPGLYNVEVMTSDEGSWGVRNALLRVRHVDEIPQQFSMSEYSVSVDSGQAGVFSSELYPQGETGKYDDLKSFYGKCCAATLNEPMWGVVDGAGVVSSSGFGDGDYPLILGYNKDREVVELVIDFMPEEPAEDEDEYGDEDYYRIDAEEYLE